MATSKTKINYLNIGLLIIRIGLGLMFIYHGYPKMAGGQPTWERLGSATQYVGIHFWPALWGFLCAAVELFGGVLLILGLAFRPVCLLLTVNLLVAVAMQLGKGSGLQEASHAIEDAVMFAGLFFIGPGKYSVDKK
jgi:putative oxidoreductase